MSVFKKEKASKKNFFVGILEVTEKSAGSGYVGTYQNVRDPEHWSQTCITLKKLWKQEDCHLSPGWKEVKEALKKDRVFNSKWSTHSTHARTIFVHKCQSRNTEFTFYSNLLFT
jgi:hypothetical protein